MDIGDIYPILFLFLIICGAIQGFTKSEQIVTGNKKAKHKINDHYVFFIHD